MCQSWHLPSRWILPSPCPALCGRRADLIPPALRRSLCRCFSLDSLNVREGQAMRKGKARTSLYLKGAGSCWLCLPVSSSPGKLVVSACSRGPQLLGSGHSTSFLCPSCWAVGASPCCPRFLYCPSLPAFQSCISHFLQQLAWFVSLVALWLIPTGLYPQHDYELLEVKNPTPCLCTLTFEWVHDKLLSSWNYVTWSLSWQIWQTRGVIFSLFWLHHTDWIEPGPWQWKPKILTIRPEGTLAVHFKWRHLLL